MARLLKSSYKMNKQLIGLTLIEVLIALAIISISLTAIIKATTQAIRSTSYLQQKTLALWAGQYVLNEARVGLIKFPGNEQWQDQTINILGTVMYPRVQTKETPNKHIKKVQVEVFADENHEQSSLINLDGFIYAAQ